MKGKNLFLVSAFALLLLSAQTSTAGYYVKKHPVPVTVTTPGTNASTGTATESADEPAVGTQQAPVMKKKGFFARLRAKAAEIPKILYIIMAILPLGWLAMGINDDFNGNDWVISLILYVLGWLPGIIYTLIKMNKYY